MARRSQWVEAYRSLGVVVFVVVVLTAAVISSCGGGGGGGSDSSGELCSQCGDTDGPCIPQIGYTPDPSLPPPCDVVPASTPTPAGPVPTRTICNSPAAPATPVCVPAPTATLGCTVTLICRRKSDSSQQRCFPANPDTLQPGKQEDVNYQWRCDGSRPGGTPRPEPTGTLSPTPSTAPTAGLCGNGVVDAGEQCDGTANGATCEGFGCTTPLNSLGVTCNANCTFNVSGCTGSCVVR